NEFLALEHLVCLEIRRGQLAAAEPLCKELVVLAERLRDGSEAPFARALHAVCRLRCGDAKAVAIFDQSLSDLRSTDAKHRLSLALISAAEADVHAGRFSQARWRAAEALDLAMALDRASEIAVAHALLARIDAAADDRTALRAPEDGLRKCVAMPASSRAL